MPKDGVNTYPLLILKSGRDRSIILKHPWIYSGAVKNSPTAGNGDIVAVCSNHEEVLGYGFFSPKNQIVCRLFEFRPQPLDFNSPGYWKEKVREAFRVREQTVIDESTDAYRLIHAEGDFFPGVIVDIYAGIAVVQLLIKGTERLSGCLVEALESVGIRKVFLKNKENSLRLENVEMINGWISREISQESLVQISENGLKFRVDFRKGQKTGFFLDQRDNRRLLGQYAKGKRVLNSFCYTGGFSVYALAQGAVSVHSVDVSKEALGLCRENVELNFGTISSGAHEVFAEDCFDYLRDTTQAYDIIVLDPPAFAKNAKSVPNACRGYKGLNLAAFQKIERGGIVFTFSCSKSIDKELFRKIVFGAAADAGRNIRILHQLSQPPDHPINIFHPESEYLKGLVLYVE